VCTPSAIHCRPLRRLRASSAPARGRPVCSHRSWRGWHGRRKIVTRWSGRFHHARPPSSSYASCWPPVPPSREIPRSFGTPGAFPHIRSDGRDCFAHSDLRRQRATEPHLPAIRQARGRGAEYWGEKHLATDEHVWRMGIPASREREQPSRRKSAATWTRLRTG
jgi:hypothetical protein